MDNRSLSVLGGGVDYLSKMAAAQIVESVLGD